MAARLARVPPLEPFRARALSPWFPSSQKITECLHDALQPWFRTSREVPEDVGPNPRLCAPSAPVRRLGPCWRGPPRPKQAADARHPTSTSLAGGARACGPTWPISPRGPMEKSLFFPFFFREKENDEGATVSFPAVGHVASVKGKPREQSRIRTPAPMTAKHLLGAHGPSGGGRGPDPRLLTLLPLALSSPFSRG